ncbi:hypothetical protein ACTACV_12615 [Pseudomonas syringae]|uniref:hypothetical protein n=1 Tax=Pseudomonas syringae TaxID=317 RepID=UPI003F7530AF
MSDLDEKGKKWAEEVERRADEGIPQIAHYIEPPFKISSSDGCFHIDAPCMVLGGTDKAMVVRITLSGSAALAIRDHLNGADFSVASNLSGGGNN